MAPSENQSEQYRSATGLHRIVNKRLEGVCSQGSHATQFTWLEFPQKKLGYHDASVLAGWRK